VDPAKKRSTRALYTAWLLRSGDVAPKQVLLFEAKQLGNLRAIRDLYRPGGLLQTLLWQPLEEELNAAGREKIHTIYFSLSGMLHQLNFGAIPVGDVAGRSAGNTLADHFNLHLLGSSRQLLESSAAPASNRMENALVIGGVQYDADSISLAPTNTMVSTERSFYFQQYAPSDTMTNRGYFDGDWEYLPWTSREADSVAIVLQKAGIHPYKMKGANASEGTFKKIAGTVSLVHIATHGYFFPEADSSAVNGFQTAADPLVRSGLLLAGGNRIWKGESPPEGQEDGVLTAYEVAQMDLRKVELVVLSACETGRGEMNNIEGVYGLQRAFKMAGARYLLMSLWQVDDRVTQEFMSAFYANWLQRKMNIPQAYRQTQHELQQRYAQPFSPLLWAGFILLE
jgi:CHAT domain-containing protein